jgi:diguanylate cyclase (GGDEF)-like protein
MKKPKIAFWLAGVAAISFAVILLVLSFYIVTWFNKKLIYEKRFASVLFIEEVRQTSEDLSRAAIAYAATGNSRFKEKYRNILDIRDGITAPRNFDDEELYSHWAPLVNTLEDGLKTHRPLMEMTKQLGFSPEESAKLELASNLTRDMMRIERAAMEAVERSGGSKESALKALYTLTDEGYLASKAQILNLIDETQALVNKRTRLAVEKTLRQTEGFFLLLLSAVVAFAASASALFWLEKRRFTKLEKSSYHDPLTKLANRAYLDLYLKLVTSKAKADGEIVVLSFVDLNGFKGINDIFGHAQGDMVLRSVAKCLLGHVRENDLVARYGGDEFVVVFAAPLAHREQTLTRMKKALHAAFKQLAADIENIKVGAAVGISIYPRPATSITMLLRTADQAMYSAKGTDNLLTVREITAFSTKKSR